LSATGRSWAESVAQRNFRFVLAAIPSSRISRATLFTLQGTPQATSSARILGLPYRALTSPWTAFMATTRASRLPDLLLFGLPRQS
jgi:hypothetical protein